MKPIKPGVMIKRGTLDFSRQPQVDPEGQTAVRRLESTAPIGPQGGSAVGGIPSVLEYKSTAGALANAVKTACIACRHHNVRAWRAWVAAATGPAATAEQKQTIQTLRGRLLIDGVGIFSDDGEFDVEATLMSFGICEVLSDWVKGIVGENPIHWPIVTAKDATCPTYVAVEGARMEVTTPAQPLGLFRPKDLDARKHGAKRYDAVLFGAAGKPR